MEALRELYDKKTGLMGHRKKNQAGLRTDDNCTVYDTYSITNVTKRRCLEANLLSTYLRATYFFDPPHLFSPYLKPSNSPARLPVDHVCWTLGAEDFVDEAPETWGDCYTEASDA